MLLAMKYTLTLIFALLMGSAFSQDSDTVVNYNSLLRTGELFSFENKSIQFKKVISDSRCPKDVTCIWAGEAKVLVSVWENGKEVKEEIVTLNAASDFKFNFSDSEEVFTLNSLDLYPYPESSRKIEAAEYCLKIQLSKKIN